MTAAGLRARPQLVPIRWRIFGFLFAIGFLEYLQQRGLTVAAERMIPDLHFSQMWIGWLEQAFVIGYLAHIICERSQPSASQMSMAFSPAFSSGATS